MFKFTINGITIALVDEPRWIHVQKNGCYGACSRAEATGVAIDSRAYNLEGHDIGGIATVEYEQVQSGTYLLKQAADIDYLSMMTGIDLPSEAEIKEEMNEETEVSDDE